MRLIAVDEKGNWKFVRHTDACLQDKKYEIYQVTNFIWKIAKTSIKVGIILAFMMKATTLSSPNLMLGFQLLLLLELIRTIRW